MEKSKVAVDQSSNVDYKNETNSIISLPPAYDKPVPTILKVARIAAITVVTVTFLIGLMVLVGLYIRQPHHCQCDKETSASQISPALARIDRMDHANTYNADDKDVKVQGKDLPMPLKLELDAALGTILKNPKNKKAEVNCVAETRKADQVIQQDPKTLMTPFGNFSTDPKTVHLVGERMVLSCITAVDKPKKSSKKAKKMLENIVPGVLPRPRRSVKDMCSCNCDC